MIALIYRHDDSRTTRATTKLLCVLQQYRSESSSPSRGDQAHVDDFNDITTNFDVVYTVMSEVQTAKVLTPLWFNLAIPR